MPDMDELRPGPRDHLITRELARRLEQVAAELREDVALDPAEGAERLARHAMREIARQLADDESAEGQAERLNALLGPFMAEADGWEAAEVVLPPRVLSGIKRRSALGDVLPLPMLPAVPFSQSDLLVNAEGQPNIGSELKAELASADSVDLICAFVIWTGVRHLRNSLAEVVARAAGSGSSRRHTWAQRRSARSTSCLRSGPRFASRSMPGRRSSTRRPGCSSASQV